MGSSIRYNSFPPQTGINIHTHPTVSVYYLPSNSMCKHRSSACYQPSTACYQPSTIHACKTILSLTKARKPYFPHGCVFAARKPALPPSGQQSHPPYGARKPTLPAS
jgi:hypothetical protein